MFIADAHCDTLYAIAIENKKPADCAVTPESLSAGVVGLQTFALFAGPEGPSGSPRANALAMMDGGALCCSDFPPLFRAAMNRICAAKLVKSIQKTK